MKVKGAKLHLQNIVKQKIVIFTYSLGGAGAERVAANLLNHLNREKYDIHLVLMNKFDSWKKTN